MAGGSGDVGPDKQLNTNKYLLNVYDRIEHSYFDWIWKLCCYFWGQDVRRRCSRAGMTFNNIVHLRQLHAYITTQRSSLKFELVFLAVCLVIKSQKEHVHFSRCEAKPFPVGSGYIRSRSQKCMATGSNSTSSIYFKKQLKYAHKLALVSR